MALRLQVLLLVSVSVPSQSVFPGHISDDFSSILDHELVVPKHSTSFKIVHPVSAVHSKFPPFLEAKLQSPEFLKPVLAGKYHEISLLDVESKHKGFDFNALYGHQQSNFQDVKPVTEIIEGDLKYDFRTKTHSI